MVVRVTLQVVDVQYQSTSSAAGEFVQEGGVGVVAGTVRENVNYILQQERQPVGLQNLSHALAEQVQHPLRFGRGEHGSKGFAVHLYVSQMLAVPAHRNTAQERLEQFEINVRNTLV